MIKIKVSLPKFTDPVKHKQNMKALECGLLTKPPPYSKPISGRSYFSTSSIESPDHATMINYIMKLTATII